MSRPPPPYIVSEKLLPLSVSLPPALKDAAVADHGRRGRHARGDGLGTYQFAGWRIRAALKYDRAGAI